MAHQRTIVLVAFVAALLIGVGGPTQASAGGEEEAARQLQLAEEDLTSGNFERAAASAASALRLDPGLLDALVVRALALQGMGRLDDAAALLRAYRDLRGTLPVDERVEPALAEIARLQATPDATDEVPEDEEEATAPSGPLTIFYGPAADQAASERAYTAARPFLGDKPAAAILALDSVLPRGDGVIVVGATALECSGVTLEGSLEDQLAAAQAAAFELEPAAAAKAADAAELHLACGSGPVERHALTTLLSVRAVGRWFAGEPEVASRLWHEMYSLAPESPSDATLPPAAQAFQLDAKARAVEQPLLGTVQTALQDGWTAWIDGSALTADEVRVPAGRRVLRLVGPAGEAVGTVLPLKADAIVLVGTPLGFREAIFELEPNPQALEWLGALLEPVVSQQGGAAALVVNVGGEAPTVRRFDGRRSLVLTPSKGRAGPGARVSGGVLSGPHPASVALLGGGLAATVVGVIVAAVAHRDGVALQGDVDSIATYGDRYAPYEAARARERVGTGLAIGGGVVAAVGGVTFVIPQRTKAKAAAEVVER